MLNWYLLIVQNNNAFMTLYILVKMTTYPGIIAIGNNELYPISKADRIEYNNVE